MGTRLCEISSFDKCFGIQFSSKIKVIKQDSKMKNKMKYVEKDPEIVKKFNQIFCKK